MKYVSCLFVSAWLLFSINGFALDPNIPHVEGELIIKFKTQITSGEEDILKIFADQVGFHKLQAKLKKDDSLELLNSYAWADIHHVRIRPGEDFDQVMGKIQGMEEVEYVEPNYIFSATFTTEAFEDAPSAQAFSSEQNRFSSAQALGAGQNVTVAVIDTGVDYTHADIASNMWINSGEVPGNGIDDDKNGYIDDINGWDFVNNDNDPYDDHYHGTHVSGIVLSLQNKARPVIKIMALKFLDYYGYGSTGDAINAIDYAVRNGAKILNNSWGGGFYSSALRDAIVATYNANRVFAVAAGNSAVNIDQEPSYPPSYLIPNMITVAALNSSDNLAWFSNYGPTGVHVGAPGVAIYSAVPKEQCSVPPCYKYLSGTSMATPYLAGVAAMMLSEQPELMHLQVKKIIMDTSVSNASLEGMIGKGSVEPSDAVTTASNTTPDGNIPPYTPSSISDSIGLSASESAGMGCGALVDITQGPKNGGGQGLTPTSGISLFLLSWPLLFVFFLRRQMRRKFVLSPF